MSIRPIVSVLMSVYNGADYLQSAVESVLQQTWPLFEFIIVNDGSTDGSTEIMRKYKQRDSRIILVEQENRGLIVSLNRGLEIAQGEYLARMDADDISSPRRLEVMLAYLEKSPDVDIVGTGAHCFGDGPELDWHPDWLKHDEITAQMLFRNCIAHPTVVLRLDKFRAAALRYDGDSLHAEDYELWERSAWCLRLGNVPLVTVMRRMRRDSITSSHSEIMQRATQLVQHRALRRMGFQIDERTARTHYAIANGVGKAERSGVRVDSAVRWLHAMLQQNKLTDTYEATALTKVMARELRRLADWSSGHGLKALFAVLSSPLFDYGVWGPRTLMRFAAKSLVAR